MIPNSEEIRAKAPLPAFVDPKALPRGYWTEIRNPEHTVLMRALPLVLGSDQRHGHADVTERVEIHIQGGKAWLLISSSVKTGGNLSMCFTTTYCEGEQNDTDGKRIFNREVGPEALFVHENIIFEPTSGDLSIWSIDKIGKRYTLPANITEEQIVHPLSTTEPFFISSI